MSSLEQFRHELQDTLTHLHDPDYEPAEQVYTALACDRQQGAAVVQSAIIHLVESLGVKQEKDSGDTVAQDFEVLRQRFVLKRTQEETAEQLNMSVRTVQRVQRRAVYMLSRRLWEQNEAAPTTNAVAPAKAAPAKAAAPAEAPSPQVAHQPGRAAHLEEQSSDWHAQVKQELTSLRQSSPNAVTEVGQALRGMLKLGQALALKHGVTLNVDVTLPNLNAAIHPTILRQVLITAIEKLVQPMSTGAITLSATANKNWINITISGYPVPINAPPHSDLINEILAAHDGILTASSNQQQTVFEIQLPVVADKITVLVVDDNADLVNFYRNYTADTCYQITHLSDGKRLLQTVEAISPQVIVLDVMLPDVDGWELLTYLHEVPATRTVPVIVCSVVKRQELAMSLGAALYLPKPVRRQAFIQALNQVLEPVQK